MANNKGLKWLTTINDNVTSSHPGCVALRAHEDSQVTDLLGLGESCTISREL